MKFHVQHPADPRLSADVGLDPDPAVAHFATIYKAARVVGEVDGLRDPRGLPAVLELLVRFRFLTDVDVQVARRELAHHRASEIEDAGARLAGTVVERLRLAAGDS